MGRGVGTVEWHGGMGAWREGGKDAVGAGVTTMGRVSIYRPASLGFGSSGAPTTEGAPGPIAQQSFRGLGLLLSNGIPPQTLASVGDPRKRLSDHIGHYPCHALAIAG